MISFGANAGGRAGFAATAGLGLALAAGGAHAETCRYDGVTSYAGRLAIVAEAVADGGAVRVDVRLQLDAQPLPLLHTHYLMEEISTADANGVERVAVNSRYRVDGHIVRQQWDVFDRTAEGLDAFRIEGKRAGEFGRQHPRFASFWDPGRFGQPWLEAFVRASPERRRDLDLRQMSASVRPPLALAFYWLRVLPAAGGVVPVFLPGFKDAKRVDLSIGPSASAAGAPRAAPVGGPPQRARRCGRRCATPTCARGRRRRRRPGCPPGACCNWRSTCMGGSTARAARSGRSAARARQCRRPDEGRVVCVRGREG